MAKCSKCKQEKHPLHKRKGFKVCADCLPEWDKNSTNNHKPKQKTMLDDVNDLADKIGMPRVSEI